MPNIATVLKEEITRLARRQVKADVESLRATVSRQRTDIAAMKREIADLRKAIGRMAKVSAKGGPASSKSSGEDSTESAFRFRPDGLKSHRERLGLSAASVGRILGVSPLTVYNWESGKSRPRKSQMTKIAALRQMGKREAQAQLEKSA